MEQDESKAIDRAVGARLRELRAGNSRVSLAEAAGINASQLAKYESGDNRISAGRLAVFARVMGVAVTEFFDIPMVGVAPAVRDRWKAGHLADLDALSEQDKAKIVSLTHSLANKG
jgi:transcriptional regulator with XRE-family HTH domain